MNIFQQTIKADTPNILAKEQIYVYVPQATSTTAGIASYDNDTFIVTAGRVSARKEKRDAYNKPDFVMLNSQYFPRTIVEKDGRKYYEYTTSAIHYIVQALTDGQKQQARTNINAGSIDEVNRANANADTAVVVANSTHSIANQAIDTARTAKEIADEALVFAQQQGTAIHIGDEIVKKLVFTSDPQTQLNDKATYKYVDDEIAKLIGTAPDALNTIEELAAAFAGNPDTIEILTQAIGTKADKTALDNYYIKTVVDSKIKNLELIWWED